MPSRRAPPRRPPPRPEINAWVVVRPDDTVVILIARSEIGQGTLTGLAQFVAEVLECVWAKVTTEYPTPGENLARNRVWGNFSTSGIRTEPFAYGSVEFVELYLKARAAGMPMESPGVRP